MASRRPVQYFDSNLSFKFLSTNTSTVAPFDLTGKVDNFSGGARLPRTRGPRIGGNGHQSPTTSPVSKLKALLCRGHTIVDPSPNLPFSKGVPKCGQLLATAKILPSRSAAIRRANPSTSTGTRSPAAISFDFNTATHSS